MTGVYKITNPKGAIYVGSSIDIERRWKQYKYLRHNEQRKLKNSFLRYGIENHTFEVICECHQDVLLEREAFFCHKFNVLDRSNLNLKVPKSTDEFSCFSEEARKRMSESRKGRKVSESSRAAFISRVSGKKQSLEHIEKRKLIGIKNPMFGVKGKFHHRTGCNHTPETIQKIKTALHGRFFGEENNNAKRVIDTLSGKIYGCAKDAAKDKGINYSTLKAKLKGKIKNDINLLYHENS